MHSEKLSACMNQSFFIFCSLILNGFKRGKTNKKWWKIAFWIYCNVVELGQLKWIKIQRNSKEKKKFWTILYVNNFINQNKTICLH